MTADMGLTGLAPSEAVIAAEQAVLGAAIESKNAAETMAEIITAADFWKPHHQLIAETVEALIEAGDPVSPVAVLNHLAGRGVLDKAGGAPQLAQLGGRYSTSLKYDAGIVAEDALRRRILTELANGLRIASAPGFESERHVDVIRQGIDKATAKVTGDQPPTIGEVVLQRLDELDGGRQPLNLVPLPWADMHQLLSGLRPGQLIVIGARPSVGKSTTGLDIARFAAVRNQLPALLFSLEMGASEVADRLIAAEASVDLQCLREQNLNAGDWTRIARIQDRVLNAPLIIDASPHCTLARIRARLRGMARTSPAKLVIVDYLGLMTTPKAESRERAVAELSRGLKLLAMEFGVALVALHQLNRESTKRNDKRPTMSDLRDSGAVEQDADVVILLHREDVHDKESPRSGEMDLIVDKNRNGPTRTVVVAYQGHYARSADMAPGYLTPPPTSGPHLRVVT